MASRTSVRLLLQVGVVAARGGAERDTAALCPAGRGGVSGMQRRIDAEQHAPAAIGDHRRVPNELDHIAEPLFLMEKDRAPVQW